MQEVTAQRIRQLMDDKGLSVRSLSAATQIPRVTLARRLHNPGGFTLDEIDAIAEALDVNAYYLVTGVLAVSA